MQYTRESIRADLKKIGFKWNWAGDNPDQMRADVKASLAKAGESGGVGSFDEIAEYCWVAYQKAFGSHGDQVIGRVEHLNAAALYGKVSEIVGTQTNFEGKHGNLLKIDKWSTVVNDSWILGGIHRQALFRLTSPRVIQNLWNQNGYFIVTAREILGLLNFGYAVEQVGPWQVLSCKNRDLALEADLLKYDLLIKSGQTIEKAQGLVNSEGSSAAAQKQVLDFRPRRL